MKTPIIIALLLLLFIAALPAQVPSTMTYQGRILQNGQPFSGKGYFFFRTSSLGSFKWTSSGNFIDPADPDTRTKEHAMELEVRNGLFSVVLGKEGVANNKPLGLEYFFDTNQNNRVWPGLELEVWFNPTGTGPFRQLLPNIEFASVPFAQVATLATTVQNGSVTAEKIAAGAVGTDQIANGSVAHSKLSSDLVKPPIGQISAYAGPVNDTGAAIEPAPGYLLCNGASLDGNNAKYAALWEVIGTTYGGTGKGSFKLPDLRGRSPLGAGQGAGLTNRPLGTQLGAETHTLSLAEMPAHNHTTFWSGPWYWDSNANKGDTGSGVQRYNDWAVRSSNSSTAGSNQPHNNMQPNLVLNFLIKY